MKVEKSLKIIKTDENLILEGDRYVEMKRKSTTEKEPEEVNLKFGMVKWGTSSQIGTARNSVQMTFAETHSTLS